MASFCAYPAWYIFPRWRRSRAPTGPPLGRLIYGRRFVLLFARSYAFIVGLLSLSLLLFFHMLIPVASRSSSRPIRLVVRLVSCVSSRAFRPSCRASCRLSCRLAVSSRRLVSVCRLVWAPFRSAVRLFSSRSPWRDCPFVVVPPCWSRRSPICSSSRPCVPSVRLVSVVSARLGRLVLICHLVLSHPWAARVCFHACSRVRAVPSCSSLVPPSFHSFSFVRPGFRFRRGAGLCVMGMGRRGLLLSVHSFHVALRSSIACSCSIVSPISSAHRSHCVLIPSSEARKREGA